jgi:chromosome partitioning protein
MGKAKIIVSINGKGGVGKSTTVKYLIREALKREGAKVLAIDFDPKQSSLSGGFGIAPYSEFSYDGTHNLVKIFQDGELPTPIKTGIYDNLYFLPASKGLEGVANSCSRGKDVRLKMFLKTLEDDFDYIFIDTNPGITSLQNNAILYADTLVMPSQAESNAAHGMQSIFDEINSLMSAYDSIKPREFFIIPSRIKSRSTTHKLIMESFINIPLYKLELDCIKDKHVEVLEPVYEKELIMQADLAEDVFFVQDYINLYNAKERKMYKDNDPQSILGALERIGNKILN